LFYAKRASFPRKNARNVNAPIVGASIATSASPEAPKSWRE
jgi:hypothetical protein